MEWTGRLAVGIVVLALVACTGNDTDVGAKTDANVPKALFGGTSMTDTPWPSDAFLRDGHVVVTDVPLAGNPSSVKALAAALSELDGAPTFTSVFFPLDAAPKDGPIDGRARWLDRDDGSERTGPLFGRSEAKELVALPPLAPLVEGHHYTVVVETDAIRPSDAMRAQIASSAPNAACATSFTVGHHTRVSEAMREVANALPAPTARVDRVLTGADIDQLFGKPTTTRPGLGDPAGIVHDELGAVVLGSFEAPSFTTDAPPKQGRIAFGSDGKPLVKAMARVPFMLTLPKRASHAKTPVIVFQHGLSASRAQVAAPANDYARAGYATIGIDALWHGDRALKPKDVVHDFGGTPGADGLADPDDFGAAISLFDFDGDPSQDIGPFDARVVRDNFRQTMTDFGELARFVKRGNTSAIAASAPALADFSFDGGPLVYSSESFGSVLGVSAFATSADLDAAAFSVPGGGIFLAMVPNSPMFSGLVGPFLRTSFDPSLDLTDPVALPGAAQRVFSLLQAAIAPGDPLSFAPKIAERKKHAVFLQARSDELIPNQAGELLALAAGTTAVSLPAKTEAPRFVTLPSASAPFAGTDSTRAFVQMVPALHTMFTGFRGERRYQPDFPPFVPLDTPAIVDNPIEIVHDLAIGVARTLRDEGKPRVLPVTR